MSPSFWKWSGVDEEDGELAKLYYDRIDYQASEPEEELYPLHFRNSLFV